ncbi:MAG: aldo/keto reductase [Candidatus Hydrogenedentes bacterium]|nr:aldo/keto reductase [Candidatus Hydrogenedentota bacterium]
MKTAAPVQFLQHPKRHAQFSRLGQVCRLGLATRGDTRLDKAGVSEAVHRGINYLNWCGHPDGMSEAIRTLGERRSQVFVAAQLEARDAVAADHELRAMLGELGTEYLDVVTYYYVEHQSEWDEIVAPGGAAETLESERAAGRVRSVGVTSHQRKLATTIAQTGRVDMVMIRYNAAHRAAEQDVFPVTRQIGLPTVTYTGLRWGALLERTPDDPPAFRPPSAPDWYRFVLCHPGVTVALMAPHNNAQLEEDLTLLGDWRGLSAQKYKALQAHGDRVHRHAGAFP